jgi:predicted Ser/Thr protein kinase
MYISANQKVLGNADMDPMIGKVVGGCYIEELIGQGGMGAVYKAHHEGLDIPVAVKILCPALPITNDVQRFLREARTSARLNHPNIISVLNVGNENGIHFIIMEYIDGFNILELLRKHKKISVSESARIGIEVIKALEAAYSHGIVHRDIKPENIMLNRNGTVKLADLGLALIDGETKLTQACMTLGSPFYIAPEQAENATSVDYRADMYSLGCTLFHMVSGTPPFKGDSPVEIILAHLNKPVPSLTKMDRSVPLAFSEVIQKLMEKKPSKRFQHPCEARLALEEAVAVIPDRLSTKRHHAETDYEKPHINFQTVFIWLFIVGILSAAGLFFLTVRKQIANRDHTTATTTQAVEDTLSKDSHQVTVLEAVLQKDTDLLRKLLVTGQSANPLPGDPISPLHAAIATSDTLALRMLLSMGADPNIKDSSGDAPLHDAIRTKNITAVASLLHMGADPDIKDQYGNSPTRLAGHNLMILKLLRKYGGHK